MRVGTLLRLYSEVPELSKAFVRLHALLYFPPSKEGLRRCLSRLEYLFPTRTLLPLEDFNLHMGLLKGQHLLGREGTLPRVLLHPITIEALNCANSHAYKQAIKNTLQGMGKSLYKGQTDQEVKAHQIRLAIYGNRKEAYAKAIRGMAPETLQALYREFFSCQTLDAAWLKSIPSAAQEIIRSLSISPSC